MQHQLQGHHHNPIILLEATIQDPAIIKEIIVAISQQLNLEDKQQLIQRFHRSLDAKGSLYLRLSKQAAYHRELSFSQADPIRVKIKLQRSQKHTDDIKQIYSGFF